MSPDPYQLLENEGALMQGCFKSSLRTLRRGETGERGPFYSACFNYAIGMERLLKLIFILHKWHHEREFPDNKALKDYGHKIQNLYKDAHALFSHYGLQPP